MNAPVFHLLRVGIFVKEAYASGNLQELFFSLLKQQCPLEKKYLLQDYKNSCSELVQRACCCFLDILSFLGGHGLSKKQMATEFFKDICTFGILLFHTNTTDLLTKLSTAIVSCSKKPCSELANRA